MYEEEEWRPIPDLEGAGYEVSNLGRVRSIVLMHPSRDSRGYPTVVLRRAVGKAFNGRPRHGRTYNVHTLVARAFLGVCPIGLEVDHKDGVLTNNKLNNLEYVTHGENMQRAHRLGLIDYTKIGRKGEANYRSKLTDQAVRWIRRNIGRFSQASMASKFGVGETTIGHVIAGRTWQHVR